MWLAPLTLCWWGEAKRHWRQPTLLCTAAARWDSATGSISSPCQAWWGAVQLGVPDIVRCHVARGSRDWRACGQVWAPGSKSCFPMWPTYEIRDVFGVSISKWSLLEVPSHAGDTWDMCHPSMHTAPFTTSSEWPNSPWGSSNAASFKLKKCPSMLSSP